MVTPAQTSPRIFVSYNRQDVAFTQRLVASLERAGAVVWVDWAGARDGDFLKRINQGLMRCEWLVLVETPQSLASDPVEMEVDAALNRVLYGQMHGVVRLVAAARDPRNVPPTWATLQYYDATSDYESAVAAMLAAIRAGDQRQARRPGAEHPGGSAVAPAIAPVVSATLTDAQRLFNRMVSATAETDWQSVEDVAELLQADYPDALKAQPPDALTTNYYRMRGRALLELARPAEAATALKTAYECDRMDIPTMRAAARAALKARDLAAAEPLLKRAVTLEEDEDERLDILREYVPTLQALNRRDEALSRVDQALRVRRDDPAWLTQRRDLLIALSRQNEALEDARTLTNHPEATAADWLALAQLARLTGALDEAVSALAHAQRSASGTDATPDLAEERAALLAALTARREQAAKVGQWAAALATLDHELTLAPNDGGRLIARADLLRQLGREGEARTLLIALTEIQAGAPISAGEALALARSCADLGLASAGWQALNRGRLLDEPQAGPREVAEAALTLAIRLARMPGAPFSARLSVARKLLNSQRPRDAWSLLAEHTGVAAEDAQLAQERGALFPLPDVPARLVSLGYRGVNTGIPAIVPPLVVVAAGPFLMGSDKARDPQTYDQETPQHRVELAAFQIGKYPVTVAEYALAVRAGAVREPPASGGVTWRTQLQRFDHPIVCVSWQDAQAYITWLREATGEPGWRLPTEAEWEKAARWDARANVSRIYPWGDSFDQTRCNTSESGIGQTTPVGSYPASDARHSGASPWGAEDMAGNVWEWTSSIYKPYHYIPTDGRENQNSTENRTLRGGSWSSNARYARAACRLDVRPDFLGNYVGFRLGLSRVGAGS